MLLKVEPVVVVAARTKDLARLDYLGRQAVGMDHVVRTLARLNELRSDSDKRQVPLLL